MCNSILIHVYFTYVFHVYFILIHVYFISILQLNSYMYSMYSATVLIAASNILEQAKQVAAPFQNTSPALVDVTSDDSLSSLIPGHNLVIR